MTLSACVQDGPRSVVAALGASEPAATVGRVQHAGLTPDQALVHELAELCRHSTVLYSGVVRRADDLTRAGLVGTAAYRQALLEARVHGG